jgi:hypothetical protein
MTEATRKAINKRDAFETCANFVYSVADVISTQIRQVPLRMLFRFPTNILVVSNTLQHLFIYRIVQHMKTFNVVAWFSQITIGIHTDCSTRIGCDGDRLYYDGCAMIILNGNILAQGSQFSLRTVEVVVATVDLSEIDAYRSTVSRNLQAVPSPRYQQFFADCKLSSLADVFDMRIAPTPIQELRQHTPEEELSLAPACWMWAYLAKSKASGFLIPLSGG